MRDHVAEYTIAKRVPFLNVDEPKHDGMADLINSESLLYLIIYAYTPPNTRIHTHTQCGQKHGRQRRLRYRETFSFA